MEIYFFEFLNFSNYIFRFDYSHFFLDSLLYSLMESSHSLFDESFVMEINLVVLFDEYLFLIFEIFQFEFSLFDRFIHNND